MIGDFWRRFWEFPHLFQFFEMGIFLGKFRGIFFELGIFLGNF